MGLIRNKTVKLFFGICPVYWGLVPSSVAVYVKQHYKGMVINETGKVTDASGKNMLEAKIKGKDLIFDEKGVFIKED